MPFTKSWASGGITGDKLAAVSQIVANFLLPDGTSGNLTVQGQVQGVLQNNGGALSFITGMSQYIAVATYTTLAAQTLSPSTLALPAVPGSGTTFWNVQVDPYTGVCTIYTSASAFPAAQPCAAGNAGVNQIIIAQQALPSTTTNYSQTLLQTPDMW